MKGRFHGWARPSGSITTGYIVSRASGGDLSWDELDQLVNPQTMSSDEESNVSYEADEKFRARRDCAAPRRGRPSLIPR